MFPSGIAVSGDHDEVGLRLLGFFDDFVRGQTITSQGRCLRDAGFVCCVA